MIHDEFVREVKEDRVEPVKSTIEKDMVQADKDLLKSISIEFEMNVAEVWRK